MSADRPARPAVGLPVERGRPDAAAVARDDAAGDRHARGPRPPRLSSNGAGGASYDRCTSVSRATTTTAEPSAVLPAVGDHGRLAGLFAQNRPKNASNAPRILMGSAFSGAPDVSPRTADCTSRSPASCTPAATSWTSWKRSIGSSLNGAVPLSSLEISLSSPMRRDQPGARLLRLVDHLPLALAQRLVRVALEHPQVPADDRRRRAELVDGQRQQSRVRLPQRRSIVVLGMIRSVAQRRRRRCVTATLRNRLASRLIRIRANAHSAGIFRFGRQALFRWLRAF